MALEALSNDGKTTFLELALQMTLPDAEVYSKQLHLAPQMPEQGQPAVPRLNIDALEGVKLARKLCATPQAVRVLTAPPDVGAELVEKERSEIQCCLEAARTYRLCRSTYRPLGMLFPPGNDGFVGSNIVCAASPSNTLHIVARMRSEESIKKMLMGLMAATTADPRISSAALDRTHRQALQDLWPCFVAGDLKEELKRWEADPDGYELTLQPWISTAVAGRTYVFAPPEGSTTIDCLYDHLALARSVMFLLLPRRSNLTLSAAQRQLLSHFHQLDATGPWAQLLGHHEATVQQRRMAMQHCLEHLELFMPSTLLSAGSIKIIDTLGFDDANGTRIVHQRVLDSSAMHVVVLLKRALGSLKPVMQHLMEGPLLARWLRGQLDPTAVECPRLSFVIYREKEGLAPPAHDTELADAGLSLQYMLLHQQHVEQVMEDLCADTRKCLHDQLLKEFLLMELNLHQADVAAPDKSHATGMEGGHGLTELVKRTLGANGLPQNATSEQQADAVQKLAARLADKLPVVWSFPLLGLACNQARMHLEAGDLAAYLSPTSERGGQKTLKQLNKLAKLYKGHGNQAQPPAAIAEPDKPLWAALKQCEEACHVHDVLGLLLEPSHAAATDMVQKTMVAIKEANQEDIGGIRVETLRGLLQQRRHLLDTAHYRGKSARHIMEQLELSVGPTSNMKVAMQDTLRGLIGRNVPSIIGSDMMSLLKPQIAQAMAHVRKRLEDRANKMPPSKAEQALRELKEWLDPENGWQHPAAPVKEWLSHALQNECKVAKLSVAVERRLQPTATNAFLQVLTSTSITTLFGQSEGDDLTDNKRADLQQLVHTALGAMQVPERLATHFNRAMYGQANPTATRRATAMKRIVHQACQKAMARRSFMRKVYDTVKRALTHADQPTDARVPALAALRTALQEVEQKIGDEVTNALHDQLKAGLTDFKRRVYKPEQYQQARMGDNLLMAVYKRLVDEALGQAEQLLQAAPQAPLLAVQLQDQLEKVLTGWLHSGKLCQVMSHAQELQAALKGCTVEDLGNVLSQAAAGTTHAPALMELLTRSMCRAAELHDSTLPAPLITVEDGSDEEEGHKRPRETDGPPANGAGASGSSKRART